jgi:uncharacterized membrane protein YfcA
LDSATLTLVCITFVAAFLNGGIGYGFSSVTVPIAVMFYSARVLNPALVLIEVGVNIYSAFLNRKSIARVWRKLLMILIGLLPAIIVGSYILKSIEPIWIKLATFAVLVPLILLQGVGIRKPLNIHAGIGLIFGFIVGLLYSITTISGPPLAMMLTNEGYIKEDFKAALGVIRIVESSATAIAYFYLGFFTIESLSLAKLIIPCVLIAMPLGSFLIGKLNAFSFRRICISIDSWLIAYGLFRVLWAANIAPPGVVFALPTSILLIDFITCIRFFRNEKSKQRLAQKDLTADKSQSAVANAA